MKSELLFHEKRVTSEEDIIEIKIWKVPKSKDFPEQIKYSLTYVHNSKRIFGYDNERGKGHHEHKFGKEQRINFTNWQQLIERFREEIQKIREELYDNKS